MLVVCNGGVRQIDGGGSARHGGGRLLSVVAPIAVHVFVALPGNDGSGPVRMVLLGLMDCSGDSSSSSSQRGEV